MTSFKIKHGTTGFVVSSPFLLFKSNTPEIVSLNCVFHGLPYFQEVEEILELLKSTWRVFGITETIHHTCYAWVLFRQVYPSHSLILCSKTIFNFIV
jgi:hypothetical protein